MSSIELHFRVGERKVSLEAFTDAALAHLIQTIRNELQNHRTVPTPTFEPAPNHPSRPEPLAVSINEAAHLVGLRPSTIRAYVLRHRIHIVRLGRRVLVPMETVRKMVTEGVEKQ